MRLSPRSLQIMFFFALVFCSFGFLKDVSGVPSTWMPNDKVMHVLIFAGLTLLWCAGFPRYLKSGLIFLVIYGIAVELAQHFFTQRTGDFWDWLADVVGIAVGTWLWQSVFKTPLAKLYT